MKPAPFKYFAPQTIDAATAALAEHADAKLLAGGQSLVPMMNFRLVKPAWLIDINRVAELRGIKQHGNRILIGSMTRHVELEESALLRRQVPLLGETVAHIGHTAIRNRGTIGGSISHADPAANLPVALLALDAVMHARSVRGTRTIAAADFFVSLFTTAIAADEVVTAIEVPTIDPSVGWAFSEFARRQGDFALASVAVTLRIHAGRFDGPVRIALGGVDDRVVRARHAEALLEGGSASVELCDAAAEEAAREINPPTDIHGSGDYRRNLVRVLLKQTLAQAIARAEGAQRSTD